MIWVIKKFPLHFYTKIGIYACNGNGMFGTRHDLFNGELNGMFDGKLKGLFNAACACFQLSNFFHNWSACYCGRKYYVYVRAVKLVATFLATRCLYRRLLKILKRL